MIEYGRGYDAEEVTCEKCDGELEIVCKANHCHEPLERLRKSKGPIPPAPKKPEPVQHGRRRCLDCPTIMERGNKKLRCERCREAREHPVYVVRACARCANPLPKGTKGDLCPGCRETGPSTMKKPRRELTAAEKRQKQIGATLRAVMLRAGVTDKQVALETGRSLSTVTCWTTGNVPITRELIPKFARQFNLTEAQLTNELRGRRTT